MSSSEYNQFAMPHAANTEAAHNQENLMASRALTIFAFLWAFAALFHQAAYPADVSQANALLVLLPALWLLMRPSSAWRFALALVLQLVQISRYGIANVSNHWAFTAIVNLTILLVLVRVLIANRGIINRGSWFMNFAPLVKIELLIFYGFVVLHKLNYDFLNPAVSCATEHYGKIAAYMPLMPTALWAQYAAIYGTLIVETAIPIMLLMRRTRYAGIILAVLFHLMLALNPHHVFYDFSAMLFAIYFLFVPYDFWSEFRKKSFNLKIERWTEQRVSAGLLRRIFTIFNLVLIASLVAAFLLRLAPQDANLIDALQQIVRVVWVLFALGLMFIFYIVTRSTNIFAAVRPIDSLKIRTPFIAFLMIALLIFNGMNPYLGLKTESSFAMFSNLHTEDKRTNHLFMPQNLKLASYQDDIVRVVDSSSPALRRYAQANLLLTYFEFRKVTSKNREASVTYLRGDKQYVVPRIADDKELSRPPAWWMQRLLKFRPVEPRGVGTICRG